MNKEEFLSFSLPYELKCTGITEVHEYSLLSVHFGRINLVRVSPMNGLDFPLPINHIKPFLHPLSDLTKSITHKGETFVPIKKLLENNYFDTSRMSMDEIMCYDASYIDSDFITLNDLPLYLKWHFDIAGLIEKGEAIDVNTLAKNLY